MGSSVLLPPTGQPKEGPDPSFRSAARPGVVSFGVDRIGPPSNLYVTRDDVLLVGMNTTRATGDTVTFRARLLLASPDVGGQPDQPPVEQIVSPGGPATQTIKSIVNVATNAAAGLVTQQINLAEGYLLSVDSISVNAGTRGQTLAFAYLIRPSGAAINPYLALFSDYVTTGILPGWPGGRVLSPAEGPGELASINQANPAAGADWVFTVPAQRRIRVQSLLAQLVAANAGTPRVVELLIDDGVNIVFRVAANVNQAINTTANYVAGSLGTPSVLVALDIQITLPSGLILPPGFRIRTVTTNINAGDQWQNIWFLTERWLDA